MPKYLDPKADLTFKKIFGTHKNLVMSLLNALLPLPDDMRIETVEYLTGESIPENPDFKNSIVDVKCTDNHNRSFIVEMQSYWTKEFFPRTLYNVTSTYCHQLERGTTFRSLKEVYALCLVNDEVFQYRDDGEYIQEFYLMNRKHPQEDLRKDLSLIFVELPRFRPNNKGVKKMTDLWLRFLTEIDEKTVDAAPELTANEDTAQALEMLRTSAYSRSELEAYDLYWLNVSTEASIRENEKEEREKAVAQAIAEGLSKGRAEGRAEGIKKQALVTAQQMKKDGMPIELICKYTGLDAVDVESI